MSHNAMPIRLLPAHVLILGCFLVMAAKCAMAQDDEELEAKVMVLVHNKCSHDVRLELGGLDGKRLDCKKGKHGGLGPLTLKLLAAHRLQLALFVFGKHGKLLEDVAAHLYLDLALWGELHKGVTQLVFQVLEEVLDHNCKVIKLMCEAEVLARVIVKI